jgi:hypothetical protein
MEGPVLNGWSFLFQMDNNDKEVLAYDFDKTISVYQEGDIEKHGADYIGPPIPEIIEEIKERLSEGAEVFIFTARVNPRDCSFEASLDATKAHIAIAHFCLNEIGTLLPITSVKNCRWTRIIDDRADQVVPNQGIHVTELLEATQG